MSATITTTPDTGTTTPQLILSPWAASWSPRNVIHDLIGGDIAVSLVAPRPRSGTMDLLYLTESDAFACADLHRAEATFTLTEDDRPALNMTYVVSGTIDIRLDDVTRRRWVVTVGYQEVTAGTGTP